MKTEFKKNIFQAFAYMREHPAELEKPNERMVLKLTEYMKSTGQGSGNHVNFHEANIADVFESNGFCLAKREVFRMKMGTTMSIKSVDRRRRATLCSSGFRMGSHRAIFS